MHVTSLFVTHDQREAFEVADQVVVLNEGRVQQFGPPQELYEHPASPFVARFLGQVNILPLDTIQCASRLDAQHPFFVSGLSSQREAQIYVRPHDLEVTRVRNGHPCWSARVERVTPLGSSVRLELLISDEHRVHLELQSTLLPDFSFSRGDNVFVTPRHANVFDSQRRTFHPVTLGQERPAQGEQIALG